MSATHTPGPWTVLIEEDRDTEFITRTVLGPNLGGGVEVAIISTGSYRDNVEAANAQLIAAAPELLAALRTYVDYDEYINGSAGDSSTDRLQVARAAIAKATGSAP